MQLAVNVKFFKKFKKEKDINVAVEVFAELSSSKLGRYLGYPILELEIVEKDGEKGFAMEYLPDKAIPTALNIEKLKEALAFEEWVLNIDLKEDHVLMKNNNAYIIDHGHTLTAWKPLYYIQQIINSKVSRFNLWSDYESFYSSVENIKSVDFNVIEKILRETAKEILDLNFCSLYTQSVANENIELSLRILKYRLNILHNLFY